MKGANAISPFTPIQAPIGENASARPNAKCDKLENLFVYEYPKIIKRATGERSKESRFSPAAKTINRIAQNTVNIQRFGLPMRF
jgi:hypothetical protein